MKKLNVRKLNAIVDDTNVIGRGKFAQQGLGFPEGGTLANKLTKQNNKK